jgi:beta-lactamase superfamily II metal-dependent hydrolase
MAVKFVESFTTVLKDDAGRRITTLLWGDPIHVLDSSGGSVQVLARGRKGWVAETAISDRSLLEIYVIDVGQGDGLLLKTPEGKWHMIDAGVANRDQMTKKGAANFLRWKFQEDLRQETVSLATVLVTHPDYDHYGGLLDVLSGRLFDGRTFEVEVENFYHSGLGRFKASPKLGETTQGETEPFPNGFHGVRRQGTFITELLDGKDSFTNPSRAFEDTFAEYAALVSQVPRHVRRLSHRDQHLPGYAPGESDLVIHLLGPVLERFGQGQEGLRVMEGESVTRNGHSIVLRLDYRQVRILLTGDLNTKSQQLLLSYHPEGEFAVDVVKACHHGSEDVDLNFVKAMQARATVISSGDNEDYAHPRPIVMGASARYGREMLGTNGEILPPLVYSTELARSVKLAYAASVRVQLASGTEPLLRTVTPEDTQVKAQEPGAKFRRLERTPFSTDLVYGLVNVRTDGAHILCATMEEQGTDFDVKVFKVGVDA